MTSVQGSRCALQASCLLVLALMLGVSASATPPVGEKPMPNSRGRKPAVEERQASSSTNRGLPPAARGEMPSIKKPFDPTEVPTVKWLPKPVPVPDADAETEARMKAYTEVVQGTEAKFDMVPIPGGKFMMGSPCGEEDRQELAAYAQPHDGSRSIIFRKTVTHTTYRLYVLTRLTQLFPKAFDMGIDGSGCDVRMNIPDVGQQAVPGLYATLSAHERSQEVELQNGEPDLLIVHPYPVLRHVNSHSTETDLIALTDGGAGSFEQRLHAKHELSHAERLGDVVVSAHFESGDTIRFLAPGGQHEDWNRPCSLLRPALTTDIHTGDVRQHEIEEDQIRRLSRRDLAQRLGTRKG